MAEVTYERRGAAAVLTIDRPERRNAVDPTTADLLLEGYRRFEADDEARILILTGAGEEAFCAGADLKSVAAATEDEEIAKQWLAPRPHRSPWLHPPDRIEADDRGDLRLGPGRWSRAGAVVRSSGRNRDREAGLSGAPVGCASDRRRHSAAAADRRDGTRSRHDPQRADRRRG